MYILGVNPSRLQHGQSLFGLLYKLFVFLSFVIYLYCFRCIFCPFENVCRRRAEDSVTRGLIQSSCLYIQHSARPVRGKGQLVMSLTFLFSNIEKNESYKHTVTEPILELAAVFLHSVPVIKPFTKGNRII